MTIYQIQLLLLYLGYSPGNPDGIDGATTRAAVKQFQEDFGGIGVDGIAGAETQKALKHAVAYGTLKREETATENATVAENATVTGTFWDDIQYFTRAEFACKCGGTYCNGYPAEPAEATVRAVDEIRRRLGVPVTISSGLRCTQHNANEGGVSNSQHLYGIAADLHSSASPQRMKEVAEAVLGNTGGIGLYSWGIHVDTRATKARWNG